MRASPELVLMMLADARLPTGAHAHSAGLEPAVLQGLTDGGRRPGEVVGYARSRLGTITATEAGVAVIARRRCRDREPAGPARLDDVESAWAARTPSAAVRGSARVLGRGYLRLGRRLWPVPMAAAFDAGAGTGCGARGSHSSTELHPPPRALVLGAVAAAAGLSAEQVARLVAYDDLQTIASAALKLLPLDPV